MNKFANRAIRRSMRSLLVLPLLIAPAFAGGGGNAAPQSASALIAAQASSGRPIAVQGIRIPNFGVVDGHIFRGEQPMGDDYRALAAIGVKTIIDLQAETLPNSRRDAEAAGLKYINIPIVKQTTLSDAFVAEFIKDVTDPANGVCYVHCRGGVHRTGSMIAIYRMTQDNWDVDKAYQEMLGYNFYTAQHHEGFKTYVFDYAQRLKNAPSSVPVACKAPQPSAVAAAAQN